MCCLHKTTCPKLVSVKKRQDFKKVYSQGQYAADHLFVAYALANGLDQNRIGITVSKKVGGAVVRNRVKRWVKESYRLFVVGGQAQFYDFIVVARAPAGLLAGKGAFMQVDKSVKRLFERLGKKVGFSL
ncbi:MAG: ribonuclease P protein component [Defluviitaleaceae bacterium]|nr:ribonuclease P protein component [Defluviitaleaceae bacterium]